MSSGRADGSSLDLPQVVALSDEVEAGEAWLRSRGLEATDPEQLRRLRAARETAIELIDERRTRTGKSRARRLALCGAPVPARARGYRWIPGPVAGSKEAAGGRVVLDSRSEVITWTRLGCRDRWCPQCSASAHRDRRRAIAEQIKRRALAGETRIAFVTLTQPKRAAEPCSAAVDRLLKCWRALRRSACWGDVRGGFRGLEVVARRAGEKVKKGGLHYAHTVEVGGIHAHLHLIVEVDTADPGPWWAEVAARWCGLVRGSPGAQDCQWLPVGVASEAIERHAAEVGAYLDLLDLYELAARAPEYVAQVLDGLDGRRLAESWGTWQRTISCRPPTRIAGVSLGAFGLGTLARSEYARDRFAWRAGERPEAADYGAVNAAIVSGPRGGLRELAQALRVSMQGLVEDAARADRERMRGRRGQRFST